MSFKYTAYGEYQCNHPSGKTIEHFYKYMDTSEQCIKLYHEMHDAIVHFTKYFTDTIPNTDERNKAIKSYIEYADYIYNNRCANVVPGNK